MVNINCDLASSQVLSVAHDCVKRNKKVLVVAAGAIAVVGGSYLAIRWAYQTYQAKNVKGWSGINFQWITPFEYFKSLYLSAHYNPPVDLSDRGVQRWGCHDTSTEQRAAWLMSSPKVYKVFTDPLEYNPNNYEASNQVLRQQGFRILGKKPDGSGGITDFHSVVEHPSLPGWVIKAGADRSSSEANLAMLGMNADTGEIAFAEPEESLMRVAMAERIRKVAKELGLASEVIVPEKHIVPYQAHRVKPGEKDPTKRYFVISQKVEFLSDGEMHRAINRMAANEQRRLADKICRIIKKAGLCDTNLGNIRLTKDRKIVFLDTEPCGSMHSLSRSKGRRPHSIEKCGRIGIYQFAAHTQGWMNPFSQEVQKHYTAAKSPEYNWKKILASILCPVIPIFEAFRALGRHQQGLTAFKRVRRMEIENFPRYIERVQAALRAGRMDAVQHLSKEQKKEAKEVTASLLPHTEGVIFKDHTGLAVVQTQLKLQQALAGF